MKIKIGDKISANKNREGVIDTIQIGMETNDIAGQYSSSVKANTYDTELNYNGSVTYRTDRNDFYWCYFNQIERVIENARPK